MKNKISLFAALCALPLVLTQPAPAAEPLSADDKARFEQVIRDYLMDNPEVLIESLNAHRARQEAEAEAQAQAALKTVAASIVGDPMAPQAGNPDGDIVLVEFFDYRCGYCKRAFPDVQELVRSDGNIRYVLKEFPILGPQSQVASRYALATWITQPDLYSVFRTAMMLNRGALPTDKVRSIAAHVGVDLETVDGMLDDPRIEQAIQHTYAQAQQLNINGTPAFVIGDRIVPGAVDLESLRRIVAEERAG